MVAALRDRGHEVRCVATGQHEDPRMYADVFAGLGLEPDAAWRLDGGEGDRVGGLLANAYRELDDASGRTRCWCWATPTPRR